MSLPTLGQLAAVKIASLQATIDSITSEMTTTNVLKSKYQAIYDSVSDDDGPNRTLRNAAGYYLRVYNDDLTQMIKLLAAKNTTITDINSSLATLNQSDKELCALLLTTYPIDVNNFDFNVKSSFVNQVRGIYENVDYDDEFKRNMIVRLTALYRNTDY